MKEIVDIYAPIKSRLPVEAKLGFVFDIAPEQKLIFYVEGQARRIRRAYFDGKSLTPETTTENNPMMDDGLGNSISSQGVPPYLRTLPEEKTKELFESQFRPASPSDIVILEMLTDYTPDRQTRIALGIDAVFTKIGAWREGVTYDRTDWELGDLIINLLRDYPVLNVLAHEENFQISVENAEHVLTEMFDIFSSTHRSKNATKIVGLTWSTISHNLSISQYHPQLSHLYSKVADASKQYLMGG